MFWGEYRCGAFASCESEYVYEVGVSLGKYVIGVFGIGLGLCADCAGLEGEGDKGEESVHEGGAFWVDADSGVICIVYNRNGIRSILANTRNTQVRKENRTRCRHIFSSALRVEENGTA